MVKPGSESPDQGTEQRILDAADRIFLRRGTDGARMQEIADEAGVNKALLHYYYRSKERLAEAVFRRVAGGLLPAVLEILTDEDLELEEKAEQVVHRYLDQLAKRPYLPGYIISEITHHPDRLPALIASLAGRRIEEVRRQVFATLGRQIEARVAAGTLAPITPPQYLVNILSLCIFPFAARPVLRLIFDLDPDGFERFIAERRRELPGYIRRALRP